MKPKVTLSEICVGSANGQRPPEVAAHIHEDYAKLKQGVEIYQQIGDKSIEGTYGFIGLHDYYTWRSTGIDSEDLLKQDGLRVLDIGCGAGTIIRNYNQRNPQANRAYGITARRYAAPDRSVIVGNLHYLDALYPDDLGPVDRAISRFTYMHLADPLSVFVMMANHVKKGGLIAVDGFSLRARPRSLVAAQVVAYLFRSGHFSNVGRNIATIQDEYVRHPRKDSERASRYVPSLLLKRETAVSRRIELPVTYHVNEAGDWSYRTA